MKNITMIFSFFILLFVSAANAQTNPREFNFSGQLTDAAGNPNTGTNVSFTLEIKSPAGCTLYRENQTLNLSTSDGYFSIGVGSVVGSTKRVSGDAGNAMQTVFRNSGVISGDSCTYTPAAGDQRQLVVTVDDGTTTETLSAQWIKTVPTALQAENAETVGGFTPSQLLRVNTTSAVLSQSNLESIFTAPNYATLTNLLAGTSTLYSKPAANGTSVLPEITAPTTPAAGQVWYNAGNIQYFDGTQTQTLSTGASTSVAVNSGSATAPSISFSGNPGSGWFSPGTGQLAAATANLERIRIVNNGNVGIGNSAPTAKLHLAPGTTAVGTAPIKLTAGANLTTPEAGAIEFDGTSLFYTDNTNTRRTVSTGGGSSVTTLAGDVTSTGTPVASTTITSGAVTTTKLANDAVSFEKLQNISNNRILGRSAAGTGDVEELTIGSGLTLTAGILSAASGVDSFALLPCADGFVPFKSAGAWGCKAADTILANNSLVLRDATGNFEGNQITTNTLRLNNAGSFVNINNPPTANYSLTLPTTAGGANQVLQTNGAGILSWASVGSGDFMASGSLPMTGALRAANGGQATPSLSFSSDSDTGFFYPGIAGNIAIANNGTERIRINANGNIGIGTTTPLRPLHINGSMRLMASATPATPSVGDIYVDSMDSHLKFFGSSGWKKVGDFLADGSTAMDGQFLADPGSENSPGMAFASDFTTGISSPAGNNLSFSVGGMSRMHISSSGNIGIGTNAPSSKISIEEDDSDITLSILNRSSSTSRKPGLKITNYMTSSFGQPTVSLVNMNGTFGSPTAVNNNTPLGIINFSGSGSSGTALSGASISAISTQNFTTSSAQSKLVFSTSSTGSVIPMTRMEVSQSGITLNGSQTITANATLNLQTTAGAMNITSANNMSMNVTAATNPLQISTNNGDISLNPGTAKIVMGTVSAQGFNKMGLCQLNGGSNITTAPGQSTYACTGVAANAVVHCSPLSGIGALTWSSRPNSADQVTIIISGSGTSAAWNCMFMNP